MSALSLMEEAYGHLGAAKMQRAPSDDAIIASHIDCALTFVKVAMQIAREDEDRHLAEVARLNAEVRGLAA